MAADYDFTIYQGATLDLSVVARAGNAPIDVTGYSARMKIRKGVAAGTALVSLTSPSVSGTGIDVGTTNGLLTVKMTAAATAALDFYVGRYDLEIESPAGVVTRVLQGRVVLSREVTK